MNFNNLNNSLTCVPPSGANDFISHFPRGVARGTRYQPNGSALAKARVNVL